MPLIVEINDRITKCSRILDLDPNSQIFAALAEAYRKKGDLDKAFRICQNGLRIHPSYGSAHVVMAKINLDRGLYDWAEAEVNKAIDMDGTSRATELLLAEIYLYKSDFVKSIRLLRELHEHDPDNTHIKKLLDIARKIPEQSQDESSQSESTVISTPSTSPALEPMTSAAVPVSGNEDEQVKPGNNIADQSMNDILQRVMSVQGLSGSLFVNSEGLVVESIWNTEMDVVTCGATMAEVNKFLDGELVKARFGRVEAVLIETGSLVFYFLQAQSGIYVFVGDCSTSLGALRNRVAGLVEGSETH